MGHMADAVVQQDLNCLETDNVEAEAQNKGVPTLRSIELLEIVMKDENYCNLTAAIE
jgi:hypothetical protein